jgi:hypothetical protein
MKTALLASLALAAGTAWAGDTTVVTFENGDQGGWTGPQGIGGGTSIDVDDGTPAPSLRTIFNNFGITFRSNDNPAWSQDFSGFETVTFSVDTKVRDVSFVGSPVTRPWLIELRDYDAAQGGFPWSSVWFKFDEISAAAYGEWTNFSVTIEETQSTELPSGWRGFGAEDPDTFAPILPDGVTFADILAGVDEVVYTTLEPGFFFGFTDFDVSLDNITVTTVSGGGCNAADVAEPFGVLDLDDVQAFIGAFTANDSAADIAEPFGVWDLMDVQAFVGAFNAGCP